MSAHTESPLATMVDALAIASHSAAPQDDLAGYRRCLGQFATGVTIVTARSGDGLVGMTANSFSSVSLDPPLVLWSAKRASASFAAFEAASHFVVNILARDQIDLSKHFGRSGPDKFAGAAWSPGIGGAPVLAGTLAHFECRRAAAYPGGDHLILIGEVERFARRDGEALLFAGGRYGIAAEHPDLASADMPGDRPSGPMHEFMTAQLYRAHGALSGALEAGRRAEGLTLLQSRVMAAVETLPGRRIDDLVPDLFLGRNTARETAGELIAAGIMVEDQAGGLTLTEAGRERNRRLLARARAIEAEQLAALPASDVAACRRVLDALAGRRIADAA